MEQMMRRDLTPVLIAYIFLILTVFFTVSSRAADSNPDVHEHGVGALNIAIQGNEVKIENFRCALRAQVSLKKTLSLKFL